MEAWSGCATACLRSHFSGEILNSSCEELRDFLLQPYRGMAQPQDKRKQKAASGYSICLVRRTSRYSFFVRYQILRYTYNGYWSLSPPFACARPPVRVGSTPKCRSAHEITLQVFLFGVGIHRPVPIPAHKLGM